MPQLTNLHFCSRAGRGGEEVKVAQEEGLAAVAGQAAVGLPGRQQGPQGQDAKRGRRARPVGPAAAQGAPADSTRAAPGAGVGAVRGGWGRQGWGGEEGLEEVRELQEGGPAPQAGC